MLSSFFSTSTPMKNFFRQQVLDLPPYHLEAHKGVKLNQNESPWDIPVEIKTAVIESLLKTPWNRYPLDDSVQVQKKLAKLYQVWPDNVLFANGSNVLIQALIIATSLDRDVMVVDPTFGVYELEAKLMGNRVTRVPLSDDFSFPEEIFLRTMKKTKPGIIFIANPNAPTGNLFDAAVLHRIIQQAECLVVIDEAYYPFSETTFVSSIKEYENLVVLRTFSKAFALGGLRLGVMLADSEICRQVQKCLLPFCVSRLTYATASIILDQPQYMEEYAKLLIAEREKLFEQLQSFEVFKVYPSQANFILFEYEHSGDLFKKLVHAGVIVRQVNDGRRLKNALRVSVGTPEENAFFIQMLKKFVTS